MGYEWLTPGEVAAAGAVFAVLAVVLTTSRLAIKYMLHSKWEVEDWLIVPAAILVVGMGVATCIGVGEQAVAYATPPPSPTGEFSYQQHVVLIIIWAMNLMQIVCLACIKMSLLFYYRTIFKVGRQIIFSVASIGLIGLVAIWMIVYFFGLMFTCGTRIDANWTSLPMNAEYCWFTFGSPAMIGWLLSWSWTDFIMDLFVLLFPIPMIMRLQMSLQRKLLILAIFSLGAASVTSSLVRAILFTQFMQSFTQPFDFDMLFTNGIYWIVIEAGFALVVVNLPILYTLTRQEHAQRIKKRLRSFTLVKTLRSRTRSHADDSGSVPLSWRQQPSKSLYRKTSSTENLHAAAAKSRDGSGAQRGIYVAKSFDVESQSPRVPKKDFF